MDIQDFKSHFSHDPKYINLNNSGQASIPDVNRDLARRWLDRFYTEGVHSADAMWLQTDVVRGQLARFLGAETDEVSFFTTTASALSQAALGMKLKPGDEILTWDQEYPSNFYPWRVAAERSGAKLIQVASENWQTPVEKLLSHITPKTRVIAISWVQYQTGAVTDLQAISAKLKDAGIWLVADVIQGVGVRPFHFHESGFDIVCGGSHKWLCSSYGAGFMVTKRSRMPELNPVEVGAMTFGTPDTEKSFTLSARADSKRFEPGSKAALEIIALGATLELFSKLGVPMIYGEASRLADRLRKELSRVQFYCSDGPIVNFAPKDTSQTMERLKAAGIGFARRGPGLRLSSHAYNLDSDIDRVLMALS